MLSHHLCLVVADAVRARFFVYDHDSTDPTQAMREQVDLLNPERRLRSSEVQSDSPGLAHAAIGLSFGLDDHRQQHELDLELRFAQQIAGQLTELLKEVRYQRALVVASPHMLGLLRTTNLVPPGVELQELALDVTHETASQLQDRLAGLGMMPPRARLGA